MIRQLWILSLVFVCGCSLVDLRGQKDGFSVASCAKGVGILDEVAKKNGVTDHWSKFSEFQVTAKDHWSWTLIRWLTPVQINDQNLQFTFKLDKEDSLMVYLNGDTPFDSIGMRDTKTYRIIKGEIIQKHYMDVSMYLAHVRHYFLFPQMIKEYPVTAYMGEGQMNGIIYDKVYVSTTDSPANSKEDQYVVWVNQKTKRMDYIEFTIRDLLPSLHGVMAYKDYRLIDGIWLPFEITLLNSMTTKSYSHRFTVQKIHLKQ
ncbi:MAG: hypothetical protein HQL15_02690 [Candidatus Omnitrophica bacterium]|nr:hypothetical protein [Candidatus Omnitrophota bacterium]